MKTSCTILAILCSLFSHAVTAATPDDGSVLPFPPTPSTSIAQPRLQDSVHRRRVAPDRLPQDAPNILIILIDDAGFGVPDTFGGFAHTPTLTKLCQAGICYNRFHTTSICSPTRAALLTGRNHQRVGSGTIASARWTGTATPASFPRRPRRSPKRCGTTATRPRCSANGTTRLPIRQPPWGHSIIGQRATGSTIFMAFSRVRHRSGSRGSWKTPRPLSPRTTGSTISRTT